MYDILYIKMLGNNYENDTAINITIQDLIVHITIFTISPCMVHTT